MVSILVTLFLCCFGWTVWSDIRPIILIVIGATIALKCFQGGSKK